MYRHFQNNDNLLILMWGLLIDRHHKHMKQLQRMVKLLNQVLRLLLPGQMRLKGRLFGILELLTLRGQ